MVTTDRRRHDRLLCAGLVEVRWSDEHGYPCETVANLDNLSPGGACLLVDSRIPPGTRIAVGHLICQVEAEVRYCSTSELGWVVGAQFLTGKTPGIRACSPSHCVDPKTIPTDLQLQDEHRLSPEVRSTIGCMTLYEAVRDKEW
jgi:PilZ domain